MKIIAMVLLISVTAAIPLASKTETDPEEELDSFIEDKTENDYPFDATDDLAEYLDSASYMHNNEMNDLDIDKYFEDEGEGSGVNAGPAIGTEPMGTGKKRGMFYEQQSQGPHIEDESADLSYSPVY